MINEHVITGVWCRRCDTFRCVTIQSRHAAAGIFRRRRCTACRHVFTTLESHYSEKNGNVCDDYDAVAPRRVSR